jgi:hypothetical protein
MDQLTRPTDEDLPNDLLDELSDCWSEYADEREMRSPVTAVVVGSRGQYLCISPDRGETDRHRVLAQYEGRTLLAGIPHVVLIDVKRRRLNSARGH